MYTLNKKTGCLYLLVIYVNDLVIASKSIEQIVELKRYLQKRFSMKSIGDIDYVLGLKIKRNRKQKKFKFNEESYARKVLERFGMTDCHPITCSVIPNASLEVHKGQAVDFPYS